MLLFIMVLVPAVVAIGAIVGAFATAAALYFLARRPWQTPRVALFVGFPLLLFLLANPLGLNVLEGIWIPRLNGLTTAGALMGVAVTLLTWED